MGGQDRGGAPGDLPRRPGRRRREAGDRHIALTGSRPHGVHRLPGRLPRSSFTPPAVAPGEPPQTVARLEREWAARHGGGEAVAVASGTTALALALRGLGLEPGDEVIVPAYGCIAPEMAVLEAGGVPVHADIRPSDY